MRSYITTLMLVATLGLVSCGGGNDVASSGASAVSAATSATTPDVITNTTATTPTVSTPTKPKINGQIDERTGVAPVVAAMTVGGTKGGGGTGGLCLSESCCPTPSEFGACLLKYYPLCQYTNICEGSSSAALSCSVQFVTNPTCAYVNADRGWDTLVGEGSLYGCAGQEGICWFSMGEGSSMTMKSKAGSSLIVKK